MLISEFLALIYTKVYYFGLKNEIVIKIHAENRHNTVSFIKIQIELVFIDKKCIFAPLINRGRVPQNLIIRLCQ